MTIADQIIQLRLQRPFVPFRLRLKDGRTVYLTERLKFAVNEFFMIIVQDRGPALRVRHEEVESIDLLTPTP